MTQTEHIRELRERQERCRALWVEALRHEGIPEDAQFVAISRDNPHAGPYQEAMRDLLRTRRRTWMWSGIVLDVELPYTQRTRALGIAGRVANIALHPNGQQALVLDRDLYTEAILDFGDAGVERDAEGRLYTYRAAKSWQQQDAEDREREERQAIARRMAHAHNAAALAAA